MSDYLVRAASRPALGGVMRTLGIPTPRALRRSTQPFQTACLDSRRVCLGAHGDGAVERKLENVLKAAGARCVRADGAPSEDDAGSEPRWDALVFDATGLREAGDIKALYRFFGPRAGYLAGCGRVLVLARARASAETAEAAAAARACEGFVRSLAREIGRFGSTANIVYVEPGAESRIVGPVRFLLSDHSAFVDGQPLYVSASGRAPRSVATQATLADKTALVTGAAQGIGLATARRLAAEGAHVLAVDLPDQRAALEAEAGKIEGSVRALDCTAAGAADELAEFIANTFGGIDIVVHNAGVTRDRSLANMRAAEWDAVQAINFEAALGLDAALRRARLIRDHARVVCMASTAGIAGNRGQTNYAATKAGLIGWVQARAERDRARGVCYNAVAPGFIETRMTAAMPFPLREAGRRLSALGQGGQPRDVAEATTFLATPGAGGLSGNVLRVCGQSLMGA